MVKVDDGRPKETDALRTFFRKTGTSSFFVEHFFVDIFGFNANEVVEVTLSRIVVLPINCGGRG